MPPEHLSPQSQATLAERIRTGDPAAEEELVRWFSERVFLLLVARTRDQETARELVQEVLFAVLRALRNGHLREGQRLSAYVHGTARNLANNYLRQRGRQPVVVPVDPDLFPTHSSDQFESSERLRLVGRALDRLEAAERRILHLTLVEGLKPGEIARQLGLTPEVVRTRKSRAVKKVTEALRKLSRK